MLKGGVIIFLYVDDIAFYHRKGDEEKALDSTVSDNMGDYKRSYQVQSVITRQTTRAGRSIRVSVRRQRSSGGPQHPPSCT
jgi:hypothetical protein